MQKLFDFLRNKKHWLILISIQVFSLSLLFNNGVHHQAIKFYISSILTGYINESVSRAYSYLDLEEKNITLLGENARLQQEINYLKRYISDKEASLFLDSIMMTNEEQAKYITARIVNLHQISNEPYFIINKGKKDGLRIDMPVMSSKGVFGAIIEVSERYAVVIPIINPRTKLSSMILNKGYHGHVHSLGHNYPAYFGGTSLQAEIQQGDTIVTSGYSYIYPEGLLVGTIKGKNNKTVAGASAAFGNYEITLQSDFDNIKHVYVLLNPTMPEAKQLEDSIMSYER